jgi:cytochrome c biogenesis protein CcmG, thiol:disulfide interchange protein DsbE
MKLKALLPLVTLIILIGFFAVGLRLDPTELPSALIDQAAPEFVLPRLDDPSMTTSLADFRGAPILVNVWGSWCVGCRTEHATLMMIEASGEIPIYGLNYKDGFDEAHQFLRTGGDPYVVSAFDADGRVGIDWGVYGAPETFLIDAQGRIRFKYIGPLSEAAWREELLPLVRSLNEAGE